MPQKLRGIRIAKPRPEAYPAQHDPLRVRVQGLRGWPGHWVDLADFKDVQSFSAEQPARELVIPESRRAFFSAFRMIFVQTRGQSLRIQAVSPIMDSDE